VEANRELKKEEERTKRQRRAKEDEARSIKSKAKLIMNL